MKNKIKLREYQTQGLIDIDDAFETDSKVLYQLPTGGGKTVIFTEFVKQHPGKRFLIMVHRKEVVHQIAQRLRDIGIVPGLIMSGEESHPNRLVQCASVQTISRDSRLETFKDIVFDYMIIDEAHHADAKSYMKTVTAKSKKNKNLKLLGVTATPTRTGKKKGLHKVFTKLIISKSIRELIDLGYLADFQAFTTPVPDLKEVKQTMGDYNITSLSQYMRQPKIVANVVNSYKTLADGKKNIVFCVDTAHAEQVRDAFRMEGFKAEMILGNTDSDERDQMMDNFKSGAITILVSVMVLTEGVDVPDTQVVQLARPTKSLVMYMQGVGRGLRVKPDGSKLIIIDNAGCTRQHGMIDSPKTWSLDPDAEPNEGHEHSLIVGRKENGVIVEDEEDMALLPIEELTADQYIAELEDTIKEGATRNAALKSGRALTFEALMNLLIKEANIDLKVVKMEFKEEYGEIEAKFNPIKESKSRWNRSSWLTIGCKLDSGKFSVSSNSDYFDGDIRFQVMSLGGRVGDAFQNEKFMTKVKETMLALHTSSKSEIDITDVTSQIGRFKRKIQEELAEAWLQGREFVDFKEHVRGDWQSTWGKLTTFNRMEFPKPIEGTGSNSVKFIDTGNNGSRWRPDSHELKSCKMSRLVEFVIKGGIDIGDGGYEFLKQKKKKSKK